MEKLGVGIVGAGWVAGEYIRAFSAHPRSEIRALCSRTIEGAKARAEQFGLNCPLFDNFEKLVTLPEIDIVCIATPPHLHKPIAVAAAEMRKHLIIEKAMATTLQDAKAIRDAVAKAQVKSVVSFVLRWNPLFEIIKTQLADGVIGNVFYGEVDYFHGIGPWYKQYAWNVKKDIGVSSLLSAGCHAVDALRWFMGGMVKEVSAFSTFGKGTDFQAYEYDPTICLICRFEDGRIGKVASCIECIQPYTFHINLVGTHGTIRNNLIYSKTKFPGQTSWVTVPTILPDSGDVSHHPFLKEVSHLVQCIDENRESHASAADAYLTHEVCFAADLSAQRKQPVTLPLE